MSSGNFNHAWPVKCVEKRCGKRKNGMETKVFNRESMEFSTTKKQGRDKLFEFSTSIPTPCGKVRVGKRKMWKTKRSYWDQKAAGSFLFRREIIR